MNSRIAAERLDNQRITRPAATPVDVVSWHGAVQAQEYLPAKWGIAQRVPPGATAESIDRLIEDGRILRTHVMRPTWHFVAAADLHWMLELTAPRVHRVLSRYHRNVGLDASMRLRGARVIERAVRDGGHVTRPELGAALARAGIAAKGVALAILTMHAEQDGIICSGRRRGKQLTYALLADRAAGPRRMGERDEALGELVTRYFRSHGPATIRDFVWWSGLTAADAKRGLEIVRATAEGIDGLTYWSVGRKRAKRTAGPSVHLLPIYDEYLVAYRDLEAVPRAKGVYGILPQAVVAGGEVAGSWRSVVADEVLVDVTSKRRFSPQEGRGLVAAARRYARFLEAPAVKVVVNRQPVQSAKG